jgi:putative lipoic acid-binding regulatory protein
VNKYPSQRTFTAIGTGGDDFAAAMCAAVADVVGTVHVECVSQRPSSGGKYLSVRVGPVWVTCGEQVIAVFNNMRKDARLKWYM